MLSFQVSPLWVALVQAAAAAPIFLFGLASGAMADLVDRKRLLVRAQAWACAMALILCGLAAAGWLSPLLLIGLVFLTGVGVAARWPAFTASTAESVPREQPRQRAASDCPGGSAQ